MYHLPALHPLPLSLLICLFFCHKPRNRTKSTCLYHTCAPLFYQHAHTANQTLPRWLPVMSGNDHGGPEVALAVWSDIVHLTGQSDYGSSWMNSNSYNRTVYQDNRKSLSRIWEFEKVEITYLTARIESGALNSSIDDSDLAANSSRNPGFDFPLS